MSVPIQGRARRTIVDLSTRGGTMAGLEFGPTDRPVEVLFLHANGFNAATYSSILAPLAVTHRILAVDQRGHGLTRLPTVIEGRRSWYDLRDDLLALMDALDLRNLVLAGHSMGGTASILASAWAPARVRRLVMFDPVVLSPQMVAASRAGSAIESPLVSGALRRRAVFSSRAAAQEAYQGRGAFKAWTPTMLTDYLADGLVERADGELELSCAPAWEASNYTAQDHDPWAAFPAISAPIDIYRAEQGSTFRVEDPASDLAAYGNITVETVPCTTHFLPMERPDLVVSALRGAL